MEPTALFAFLCGVFVIAAAALGRDWFFNNWRTRFFVGMFGRDGARMFYGPPGAVLAGRHARRTGRPVIRGRRREDS